MTIRVSPAGAKILSVRIAALLLITVILLPQTNAAKSRSRHRVKPIQAQEPSSPGNNQEYNSEYDDYYDNYEDYEEARNGQ